MPSLRDHQSAKTTKLLLIGDSGTGKTGALASLASAGYKLRIIDTDNGLDILRDLLLNPKSPYDKSALDRVVFRTVTEKMKNLNGSIKPVTAKAWPEVLKLLSHWKTDSEDLGPLESWDSDTFLVLDSLTMLSNFCYFYQQSLNGRLGAAPSGYDYQRDIGQTQAALENLLQLLYDTSIKCNVLVTSHIAYVEDRQDPGSAVPGESRNERGYPSAIGKALSPRIPRYFNTVLMMKTEGTGASAKQYIYTVSQGIVGVKTSAPLRLQRRYGVEQGLAEFMAALRGGTPVLSATHPAKEPGSGA